MISKRDFGVAKCYKDNPTSVDWTETWDLHQFDTSAVLGYSESDLERALANLEESRESLFQFGIYLDPVPSIAHSSVVDGPKVTASDVRTQLIEQLHSKRLFREALARIRGSQKSHPQ
jgi:hypothetical protein